MKTELDILVMLKAYHDAHIKEDVSNTLAAIIELNKVGDFLRTHSMTELQWVNTMEDLRTTMLMDSSCTCEDCQAVRDDLTNAFRWEPQEGM